MAHPLRCSATGAALSVCFGRMDLAFAVLRTTMLNHWYHHRGQLSAYLRLLDVPVPVVYGPTADENPFA